MNITRKRPHPEQKVVGSIKIRKLENENYQIEPNNDSYDTSNDHNASQDSYSALDQYQSKNSSYTESYTTPQTMFDQLQDSFLSQASYDQSSNDQNEENELVCTPSFDAFDSIIQSQEEEDMDEPPFDLPLEIKIESVTSLNPNFDYPLPRPGGGGEIREPNEFMESIYKPEEMPRGSPMFQITQAYQGKKTIPVRHVVYIFADDGNRYFPCHCCTSAFIKKYLLIKHLFAKHKDIIACKLCGSIFYSNMQDRYQQHMKAHNTRLPTQTKQCPLCLFWVTPKNYQGHLSLHNLLQKHICRQCRQEFSTFYARARHICPVRR